MEGDPALISSALYVSYFLENADDIVEGVGYFAAAPEAIETSEKVLAEALGSDALPSINAADYEGQIMIAGSSTVYPVSSVLAEAFKARGCTGSADIISNGTGGGFNAFSVEALVAILQNNISNNVGRRLEREQRFFADSFAFESAEAWQEICAREEPPAGYNAGVRASDYTAFFNMDEDRAGYLVEYGKTEQIFTSPKNELTEQYITGRFG